MSRIKSVNHGFNEVNDECARIFVNLVIYMHAKNSDEMPLLMYFISKLHPMKTGSCKYLRDHFSCIHVSCNVTGLLSLKRPILVKAFK